MFRFAIIALTQIKNNFLALSFTFKQFLRIKPISPITITFVWKKGEYLNRGLVVKKQLCHLTRQKPLYYKVINRFETTTQYQRRKYIINHLFLLWSVLLLFILTIWAFIKQPSQLFDFITYSCVIYL
jgi:hypothetical protein